MSRAKNKNTYEKMMMIYENTISMRREQMDIKKNCDETMSAVQTMMERMDDLYNLVRVDYINVIDSIDAVHVETNNYNEDIFVDGEYIEERNNNSIYRGSDNQHIYFFTNKYSSYSDEILKNKNREFSFDIKDDGEVFFIGIPPKEFYEKFLIKIGGIKNEWKEGIRS